MNSSGPVWFKKGPNLEQKLIDAASKPDVQEVRRLIEEEHIPINSTGVQKQTAAHFAAEKGHLAVLQYLVGKEPSLASAVDQRKQTPLHLAVENGALDVVEYLLDTCNVNLLQYGGLRTDNNVLHIAAEAGKLPMVRYLIEKKNMDPNERNSDGQTAVMLAARDNYIDIVKYLVENTNANLTVVDGDGRNILFMSASSFNGKLDVPRYVLDERNATIDVNWQDKQGITVTYFACRFFHFDTIKYYVEEKHANVNIADNENRTALHLASKYASVEMVDYLLDHGADPLKADIFGRTPLDTKADKILFDPQIVERLEQAMEGRRTQRSLADDRSLFELPTVLAEGSHVPRRFANLDRDGGVRLVNDQFVLAANNILLLASAFIKPQRTPQSQHEAINSRMDWTAVDAIESNSYS